MGTGLPGRIGALREGLLADRQAVMLLGEENRRYFTGFPSSAGVLLITQEDAVLFVDGRYIESAAARVKVCAVEELKAGASGIAEWMEKRAVRTVFLEHSVRFSVWEHYRRRLSEVELFPSEALEERITRLRRGKDAEEAETLCRAQEVTDKAFSHILRFIRPGVREWEIALELEVFMRKNGAQSAAFETIAVSGPNGSKPHGTPGERQIEPGDFITMDFGAQVDGYHADMTRTVAVGSVSDEMADVYDTVLRAQLSALAALKPGTDCAAVDAAARQVIRDAGFGEYFSHSTGHGVGLEIHEAPSLASLSKEALLEGDAVTVEPGIYLPGRFGVRIEDMAMITAEGYRNLTASEKKLIVL